MRARRNKIRGNIACVLSATAQYGLDGRITHKETHQLITGQEWSELLAISKQYNALHTYGILLCRDFVSRLSPMTFVLFQGHPLAIEAKIVEWQLCTRRFTALSVGVWYLNRVVKRLASLPHPGRDAIVSS